MGFAQPLALLLGCATLCCVLLAANAQEVTSYAVADCSKPCAGDYVCFLCKSGAYKARCFLQTSTFPNMVCCTSYATTTTTCDAGTNPKCCDSWKPSVGLVVAIALGSLAALIALSILAWYLVRRHRRANGGYEEFDQPTPTVYAEQYAAHQKRHRPYSSNPADTNAQPTAYGSYQSF